MRKFVLACVVVLAFNTIAGSVHAGLDPSLVGWWTFDEGQGITAYDSSGNGNDGTLTNGPQWTAGHLAGALAFPTTVNAFVEVPDSPELNPTEAITIAAWINPEEWTGNNRIMQKGTSDNQFRFLRENGDNFVMHLAGLTNGRLEGFATPPAGEWTHVAGTYDGSDMKVYYNGAVAGEQAASGQISTSGDSLFIGTKHATAPVGDGFGGAMDDVRLYNRAVAQQEIPTIMRGIAPELATGPNPEDEAIDIPLDTPLTWKPGEYAMAHDVYLGTVFEDVNDASRTDPMGVLLSQGQSETTLDPAGIFDFGQTYYWRVDEVNAAPDNTIFKGEVWSFTAEPFAYPIENITATSNGVYDPGTGPENTVNGSGLNELDQHSAASTDMFLASPADGTVSIEYEFDQVYKLYEMLVWNYNVQFEVILGFGFKDVTVEYSENGTDWTTLGDVQFAQATARADYVANTTVAFNGVPAKYVRLTANTGYGMMGQFGLSEVRFMYIPANAREPQPADGATEVSVATALSWRAGREAVSHDVYYGTDAEALALAGSTTAASYSPGPLAMATTYYWKVDEVNEADETAVWPGRVWSFVTQEFIVVDDFESYTDDEGIRIYEAWADGWVNDSGSTVGYLTSPFAEQTIVHSGGQSMPLAFDNTGGGVSETDLTLAQDWTASGIKSLSLYFYGDPDNTAGQLYVKINGTKVLYDGTAANLTLPGWHHWNIDLAATGANLSNVTQLTIGIEGAGAQGMLFIDDIRLYPEVLDYFRLPDVTVPGDTVVGVPNDGDWPAAEYPDLAIDDDVNTKFLHRKGGAMPTGIQVTPSVGATIVIGLTFTTANDAPTRDPVTYELYGSNGTIDGPYELIAAGDIVDFAGAAEWPRFTKNETLIRFDNDVAYAHYQIVFPTLRDATETLMQIAEIELIGTTP